MEKEFGDPYGTRTRVFAVKGRRPRPLDEGATVKRVPGHCVPGRPAPHVCRRGVAHLLQSPPPVVNTFLTAFLQCLAFALFHPVGKHLAMIFLPGSPGHSKQWKRQKDRRTKTARRSGLLAGTRGIDGLIPPAGPQSTGP